MLGADEVQRVHGHQQRCEVGVDGCPDEFEDGIGGCLESDDDGDGEVDEELLNGVDDDGDGEIDEDIDAEEIGRASCRERV